MRACVCLSLCLCVYVCVCVCVCVPGCVDWCGPLCSFRHVVHLVFGLSFDACILPTTPHPPSSTIRHPPPPLPDDRPIGRLLREDLPLVLCCAVLWCGSTTLLLAKTRFCFCCCLALAYALLFAHACACGLRNLSEEFKRGMYVCGMGVHTPCVRALCVDFVVFCLLPVACCLLSVVCCVLPVVSC